MTQQIFHKLSVECDIHLDSIQQLRNAQNLLLIAFKVLYQQQNDFLSSKLSSLNAKNDSFSRSQLNQSVISNQSNPTKAGNNVVLINTLLKHIKSDKNLKLPTQIRQLTFYNLLQEDQLLCRFVQWMIEYHQKNIQDQTKIYEAFPHANQIYDEQIENFESTSSNRFRNIELQSTKPKQSQRFKTQQKQINMKTQQKQSNELENLYFASNLKQKTNDSPVNPQPQSTDRIVRKGSFKLLKPKVMFSQQTNPDNEPKQLTQHIPIPKKHNFIQEPEQLKEISMIESNNNYYPSSSKQLTNFSHQMSNLNDSIDEIVNKKIMNTTPSMSRQHQNHRKTVPKNMAKPPLYRSSIKNKQNQLSEQKTIEQKLKKKNFFNFDTQNQEIVSNFNYETVKNIIEQHQIASNNKQTQNEVNQDRMKEFYSGKFSQVLLKKQEKNLYNLENSNIIQQDDSSNIQRTIEAEERRQSSNRTKNNLTNGSSLIKLKNHFLQKQLYTLDQQIHNQQIQLRKNTYQNQKEIQQNKTVFNNRSTHSLQNSRSKNDSFSSAKRSTRKVSKVQIKQIQDNVKQDIIDWLDDIHIINGSSIELNELSQKFTDGVKFVQLCNHYIGRGRAIPYFKNPKKNAEIHSNFNKVFQHLKTFSQFSQKYLLFAYQLFVPFPQQDAIWGLLEGIYKLFIKKGLKQSNSKNKDYSLNIQQQSESLSRENIKETNQYLNHSTQILPTKKQQRNHQVESSVIKKQKSSSAFKNQSLKQSRQQSTFSRPIEFIPMVPDLPQHTDLIQQSQEPQDNQGNNVLNINQDGMNRNVLNEGYKEKYLRRAIDSSTSKDHNKSTKNFISLQTPKKQSISYQQKSFIGENKSKILNNSVINRSSSKKALESQLKKLQNSSHKLNSVRKNSSKKAISKVPKVTLNMQMKVDRIMNELNLGSVMNQLNNTNEFSKPQLFQDPIRNGTLINIFLAKLTFGQFKYIKLPHSIQHCRQNYNNIFNLIKNKYGHQLFQNSDNFMEVVEQILKGQQSMFYSIAYQLSQIVPREKGENYNSSNILQNEQNIKTSVQNYSKNLDKTSINKAQMVRLYCNNQIQWIRLLQLTNPMIPSLKIRSVEDLHTQISAGTFLYFLLQNPSVNMVYLNPSTVSQKEANLKKVMVYMIQMKIFKRQDFMNVHQIAQKNIHLIDNLIQKLVEYTVSKEWTYIERNMNNLKKMLIQQISPNKNQKQKIEQITTFQLNNQKNQTILQKNVTKNNDSLDLDKTNSYQMQKSRQKGLTKRQREEFEVEIPWMRKLGFTNCSLNLNNGILLCRLISKLTRTNIKFNQNISHDAHISKPEALAYIRKALKLIPGCRIDELDVYNADERKTLEIYSLIREKFRNNYEMGKVVSVR